MTEISCDACGAAAKGNYCSQCGVRLVPLACSSCAAPLPPSARFCNHCGTRVRGGERPSSGTLSGGGTSPNDTGPKRRHAPARAATSSGAGFGNTIWWWVGGLVGVAAIAILGVRMTVPNSDREGGAPISEDGGAAPPDLTTMTRIEAADRLFNRVMTADANGDSTQVQQFIPMAIGAYERARPLNADGLFHLALLQRTALNLEEALSAAESILVDEPNHLLGLYVAAQTSHDLGRGERATEYYERLVASYAQEMANPRQEYLDHGNIARTLEQTATDYLAR